MVGHCEAGEGIGFGEHGVVPGVLEGFLQHIGVERAGMGEPLRQAAVALDENPDADPEGLGRREGLDLTVVGLDRGRHPAGHGDLEVFPGPGPFGQPGSEIVEIGAAHDAVPPTVSDGTRSVGVPIPTGTPWPSLPQVPG